MLVPLACTLLRLGSGSQPSERFGEQVLPAGDVNGDGLSDVIVTGMVALSESSSYQPNLRSRRSYVYLGLESGVAGAPLWMYEGQESSGATLGVGDVDGDGYGDIAIGMLEQLDALFPSGFENTVAVFRGSPFGPLDPPEWYWAGPLGTGSAVAGCDVNGDHRSDLIVGSRSYGDDENHRPEDIDEWAPPGIVSAFHGRFFSAPSPFAADPDWQALSGDPEGGSFGLRVTSLGDVNSDGYCDVVVAGSRDPYRRTTAERSVLYVGGPQGLSTTAARSWQEDDVSWRREAVAAGDTNGDGYSDMVARVQLGEAEGGEQLLELYLGGPGGLEATPQRTYPSDGGEVQMWELWSAPPFGSAGDLNGDGYDDLFIRGPLDQEDGHSVWILLGSELGPSDTRTLLIRGETPDEWMEWMRWSVAGVGDVNGDGFDDIALGAPWAQDHVGEAYVCLGSADLGVVEAPPAEPPPAEPPPEPDVGDECGCRQGLDERGAATAVWLIPALSIWRRRRSRRAMGTPGQELFGGDEFRR